MQLSRWELNSEINNLKKNSTKLGTYGVVRNYSERNENLQLSSNPKRHHAIQVLHTHFNLHAHHLFIWDTFHYYPPMLFRSPMSFLSLKFSNQNYVGLCIFHIHIGHLCPSNFVLLVRVPAQPIFKSQALKPEDLQNELNCTHKFSFNFLDLFLERWICSKRETWYERK